MLTASAARGADAVAGLCATLMGLAMMPSLATAADRYADGPTEVAREAEAARLLTAHAAAWVAEIAGFNRRNAACDPDAARAAAAYDATHRARFKRTLGWRFDAGSARWTPAAPAQAEVTLVYSGSVHSGVVTSDGGTVGYCRAEAPDLLETWWAKQEREGSVSRFGTSLPLPALAPGFVPAGVAPPPPVPEAAPPRAEIDARIAKATEMLAQDVAGFDAFLAADGAAHSCSEDKAREDGKRWAPNVVTSTRTRTDGPVRVVLKGVDDFGPRKLGDRTIFVCGAFPTQATIEATATWPAEGDNELVFTVDARGKP